MANSDQPIHKNLLYIQTLNFTTAYVETELCLYTVKLGIKRGDMRGFDSQAQPPGSPRDVYSTAYQLLHTLKTWHVWVPLNCRITH